MLHSFYSFDYILKIPIKNITRLLRNAKEKELDNLLMQRWMLHYQDEISFDEFKNKLMVHRANTNKTDEEILTDVKDIINTFNKEVT